MWGVWRFNKLRDGTWTQQCLGTMATAGEAISMHSVCTANIPGKLRYRRQWLYWGPCSDEYDAGTNMEDSLPANNEAYRAASPKGEITILR